MTSEERRIELSKKFLLMGQSLLIESSITKDFGTRHAGMVLILLSTNMVDEDNMILFDQLCAMFSAKKTLDELSTKTIISDYLKRRVKPFIDDLNKTDEDEDKEDEEDDDEN